MLLISPLEALNFSDDHRVYVDFYFFSLKSEREKLWFTSHFQDEDLIQAINSLTFLFCKYEYKSIELLDYAKKIKVSARDIFKWHKSFLLHEAEECKIYGKELYFKEILSNPSFRYLVSLQDENNFENLYVFLSSNAPENFNLSDEEKLFWHTKKKKYELYLKNGNSEK